MQNVSTMSAIILVKLTARAHGLDSLMHPKETEASIRRCQRSGLCSEDTATFAEFCDTADERLFARVIGNSAALPTHCINYCHQFSSSHMNCDLRHRRHNRALPKHPTRLSDANFMYRLLYLNSYLL